MTITPITSDTQIIVLVKTGDKYCEKIWYCDKEVVKKSSELCADNE